MKKFGGIFSTRRGIITAAVLTLSMLTDASSAAVVARNSRGANSAARRAATTTPVTAPAPTTTQTPAATPAPAPTVTPAPTSAPEIVIEDKSDIFTRAIGGDASNTNNDASSSNLADMVRRQRAALDAESAISTASNTVIRQTQTSSNPCDANLRACMTEKCGTNFAKCSGDTDMTWGDKMDTCRRSATCTGREYQLFSAEIKADRDAFAELAEYDAIIECGTSYHNCIVEKCGTFFGKCLGKKAGDKAIADCKQIAQRCTQQDSGLAARTMGVFGTLRENAQVQISADEKRLYELRDAMRSQCQMLGAMFDERTFDCVYTVNFFAANNTTPYSSKKAYAGASFDCTQNWFGVDITTFKENAYRYAREQTSATSAMLGAGIGVAGGAITSGAINRAIDRQKAQNALKDAEKQHEEAFNTADTPPDKPESERRADKAKDKAARKSDYKPESDNDETDTGNNNTPNLPVLPELEEPLPTKPDGTSSGTDGEEKKKKIINSNSTDTTYASRDTHGYPPQPSFANDPHEYLLREHNAYADMFETGALAEFISACNAAPNTSLTIETSDYEYDSMVFHCYFNDANTDYNAQCDKIMARVDNAPVCKSCTVFASGGSNTYKNDCYFLSTNIYEDSYNNLSARIYNREDCRDELIHNNSHILKQAITTGDPNSEMEYYHDYRTCVSGGTNPDSCYDTVSNNWYADHMANVTDCYYKIGAK